MREHDPDRFPQSTRHMCNGGINRNDQIQCLDQSGVFREIRQLQTVIQNAAIDAHKIQIHVANFFL